MRTFGKSLAVAIALAAWSARAEVISVKVSGMVCAFCAQGIEKKFRALPETANVKVSLETKKVEVSTKDGQGISDDRIRAIIKESGYEVLAIDRTK